MGLASLSSVTHQLGQLEKLGYIRRDPRRPRALEILLPLTLNDPGAEDAPEQGGDVSALNGMHVSEIASASDSAMVPLVGRIAAGGPILADQSVEDVVALPRQLVGHGELFMLKVSGDSMVDAAICDGDWVVVRRQSTAENGDIVAALLDDEATVDPDADLEPEPDLPGEAGAVDLAADPRDAPAARRRAPRGTGPRTPRWSALPGHDPERQPGRGVDLAVVAQRVEPAPRRCPRYLRCVAGRLDIGALVSRPVFVMPH